MKERELREHADCSLCRNKIGHTGIPAFWIVTVERHGIDVRVVKRQDGLAALLGSPRLAQIMGPDEEMTIPLMDPVRLTVCERCAVEYRLPLACWVPEAESSVDG